MVASDRDTVLPSRSQKMVHTHLKCEQPTRNLTSRVYFIELCYCCCCCCCCCLVTQACPILFDLMDCSPPGSSAHRILQPRILQWVAIPFSRDRTCISCIGVWILYQSLFKSNLYLRNFLDLQTSFVPQ